MDIPVWFTVLFSGTGLTIVICFAFQYGVFGECCKGSNNGTPVGTHQSTGHGVGVGVGVGYRGSPRSEGMGSSQVSTVRAESEEEGAYGSSEEESRRSGGLSSDERSEEDEDWRGTV